MKNNLKDLEDFFNEPVVYMPSLLAKVTPEQYRDPKFRSRLRETKRALSEDFKMQDSPAPQPVDSEAQEPPTPWYMWKRIKNSNFSQVMVALWLIFSILWVVLGLLGIIHHSPVE